ncbi:potassium-transporting ATPase subunit KdpA, partial [Nitrolancea hollandica]|uniref:potassium-transporting ATPase subunit KdpA n=1 Tax=Nitrolancea hollandica TaxID=1206749 RepID=UPI00058FAEA6
MTFPGWLQIIVFFLALLALTKPLGSYMARVFNGERTILSPALVPVERGIYRIAGVNANEDQRWWVYAIALLLFNLGGVLLLYVLQRIQGFLPFNPQGFSGLAPDLAFNTAVSFFTNTNWQSYGGESTMSYLTQMAGLTVQNFVSAATGIAIALALIRGFARRRADAIGNFWVDLVRATLYVLLPLATIFALLLVWQGVPQNLNAYTDLTTLQGTT